jgi:hypothetical protein
MCPQRLVLNKKVLCNLIDDNMKNIMVTIQKKDKNDLSIMK